MVRRWAVLSFDSSALQPDLRILRNTSIFYLNAYHPSFSTASAREPTGRSAISFRSIFFLFFGGPRSSAWITVRAARVSVSAFQSSATHEGQTFGRHCKARAHQDLANRVHPYAGRRLVPATIDGLGDSAIASTVSL